jgi:hypothetical protein
MAARPWPPPIRDRASDCAGTPLVGRANGADCGRKARPGTAGPVVCHANRCVLADPDGDESPATAVAGLGTARPVVCPPRKRGPRAVGGDFRRTAVAGENAQGHYTI